MTSIISTITALVIIVALVVLYFLGENTYKRIEGKLKSLSVWSGKVILFILPLLLTFGTLLLITYVKIFGSFSRWSDIINSNTIDLIFILILFIFHLCRHLIYRKTKVSFLESFHAYETEKDVEGVLFLNLALACTLFACVCFRYFRAQDGLVWIVFLFGRLVWLDKIDKEQICILARGIKAQKWLTLLFAGLYWFALEQAYSVSSFIPDYLSQGIMGGIVIGAITSLAILLFLEAPKIIKNHLSKSKDSETASVKSDPDKTEGK